MSFFSTERKTASSSETEQNLECVYSFIADFVKSHGYSPTLREIADGCYLGRSTVVRYLDKLEAKGRIAREEGKPRSIALLESS